VREVLLSGGEEGKSKSPRKIRHTNKGCDGGIVIISSDSFPRKSFFRIRLSSLTCSIHLCMLEENSGVMLTKNSTGACLLNSVLTGPKQPHEKQTGLSFLELQLKKV